MGSGLLDFRLAAEHEATEPAEIRGAGRDAVRLLVCERASGSIAHRDFRDLDEVLEPGTLLVVNNSATIPTRITSGRLDIRFVAALQDDTWLIGLAGAGEPDLEPGSQFSLPAAATLTILARASSTYWKASMDCPVVDYLLEYGQPHDWPLDTYQTVFSTYPGSTAMPSAGRPFSADLVTRLVSQGIVIAPIMLHTNGTCLDDKLPLAERFLVPEYTAQLVNTTRTNGGQVIAVGSTVVRALESATDHDGMVQVTSGWTEHVVSPTSSVRAVDGLITSLHEPRSSHLMMLSALAGTELLARSYEAAIDEKYLWNEFGDLQLIV